MSGNRADLEQVENGFKVRIWCESENKDEYGYTEPAEFVAKDIDEALGHIKNNFKVEDMTEEKGES